MRDFNVEGPCDLERHFTIMREVLVEKGIEKIEKGKYFTIFAPRQAGKTTYFQLLIRQLQNTSYLPVWISFEELAGASKKAFYATFDEDLRIELAQLGIKQTTRIKTNLHLQPFFRELTRQGQEVVLIIDEFDGIASSVISELMHTFRKMYHKQKNHRLLS